MIDMVSYAKWVVMGEDTDLQWQQEAIRQRERERRTNEADGYFAPEQED